ncbi:hypothetical protein OHA21_20135 [Actinoplanes sp. NBC_00393]|uniref:hypothetical protein n=1 Tax=Actinoplanes sp. NBC_00393 TaxID=2975953 RepID=UPI002E1B30F6
MSVRVAPILSADVPAVAEFLHRHLNARQSPAEWAESMTPPWQGPAPNHGFMLVDDGRPDPVVGAYLAFYSTRTIGGAEESFCNLAGWCVLPDRRIHSVRLLKALLDQPDYTFTDLTPSGNAIKINTRLGFRFLDAEAVAVPNLPWLSARGRVSSDPRDLERLLTGAELERYRDHRRARAARHVVLSAGDDWCYVMFRRDHPRNLPLFASLIHVSDPVLFRRLFRPFCAHLLLRYGIPATLVEPRLAGFRPRGSVAVPSQRRKMFRSPKLQPDQIDYLYSELACVTTAT